ncbi:hypothetical protein GA0115254_120011 [Streptomyces sp. Ncost-T10-10d]|nr:hypothetical protein GA0115254_120011 [Streptomyces sp. Ncost-T10-10d]
MLCFGPAAGVVKVSSFRTSVQLWHPSAARIQCLNAGRRYSARNSSTTGSAPGGIALDLENEAVAAAATAWVRAARQRRLLAAGRPALGKCRAQAFTHRGSLLVLEGQHTILGHQSVKLLLPVRGSHRKAGDMPMKM